MARAPSSTKDTHDPADLAADLESALGAPAGATGPNGTFDRVFIQLSPSQLVPNPKNPRRHPKSQLEALVESIRVFGQVGAVVARRANKMLIAGHGFVEAAKMAGLDRIRVELWDVDQQKADAFMVASNRLAELGMDDDAAIKAILAEAEDDWLQAMGFVQGDKTEALSKAGIKDLEIKEIDTSPVEDTFYVTVRGPLALQSKALQAFKAIEREHPELEVLLGTTNI
jgi:Fe2+ transport system protein FeoA